MKTKVILNLVALLFCVSNFAIANLPESYFQSYGNNLGKGNLLSVSPYLTQKDYQTEKSFFNAMNEPLANAKKRSWLNKKTIAIYPEMIGLYLIAVDEKCDSVCSAPNTTEMASTMLMLAGSVVLPMDIGNWNTFDGKIVPSNQQNSKLYNISVVYAPNGRAHRDLFIKSFPTDEEYSRLESQFVQILSINKHMMHG